MKDGRQVDLRVDLQAWHALDRTSCVCLSQVGKYGNTKLTAICDALAVETGRWNGYFYSNSLFSFTNYHLFKSLHYSLFPVDVDHQKKEMHGSASFIFVSSQYIL